MVTIWASYYLSWGGWGSEKNIRYQLVFIVECPWCTCEMYMYVTILSWSFRHGKCFTMFKKLFFRLFKLRFDFVPWSPSEILITPKVLAQNVGAPNVGLEPTTLGLRVPCSTDWANRAQWTPTVICNDRSGHSGVFIIYVMGYLSTKKLKLGNNVLGSVRPSVCVHSPGWVISGLRCLSVCL